MPIYISTETRKEQANLVHNNKYDYSLWPDILFLTTRVISICPTHGEFEQTLKCHIGKKYGCPKCGREKAKETWIKTLGVDNPSKSKTVEQKKQQTSLKNFGVSHPRKNQDIVEKAKETCQKRYGGNAPICSSVVMDKMNATCVERHGVKYPQSLPEIKEKAVETTRRNHGVDYPQQSPEIRKKTVESNLRNHGVRYPQQSPEIRKKTVETYLARYGAHPRTLDAVKQKYKETMLERHGVESPQQSPEIRKKTMETNLERYGSEYPAQHHLPPETIEKLNSKEWLIEQHHVQKKPLLLISRELGVSDSVALYHAKKHGIETKYFFQSTGEKEVGDFISSLGIKTITNTRKLIPPFELDIFLPDTGIAIEYNGEYWHGFPEQQERDKEKQRLCEEKGIILLTIWESDWYYEKSVIMEMLATILLE